MAARPQPLSSLTLCRRLAKNSVKRLKTTVECVDDALSTSLRLTADDRAHYRATNVAAAAQIAAFEKVLSVPLPKAPAKPRARKIGRPSLEELAAGQRIKDKDLKTAKGKGR